MYKANNVVWVRTVDFVTQTTETVGENKILKHYMARKKSKVSKEQMSIIEQQNSY